MEREMEERWRERESFFYVNEKILNLETQYSKCSFILAIKLRIKV